MVFFHLQAPPTGPPPPLPSPGETGTTFQEKDSTAAPVDIKPAIPVIVTEFVSSRESIRTDDDEMNGAEPLIVHQVESKERSDSQINISGSIPETETTLEVAADENETDTAPPLPMTPPPPESTEGIATEMESTESSPLQQVTEKSVLQNTSPINTVEDEHVPVGFIRLELQLKKRARSGLGITVVITNSGLFMIRRIMPGGVAAKDGRLRVGDRLVSINDKKLAGLTHAALLQVINDAPKDCQLVIWRDPECDMDAASSIYSFGSRSNISGSRSSILSDDDEDSLQKHFSLSSGSPLTARFSTSFLEQYRSPTGRNTSSPGIPKRWSLETVATNRGPAGEYIQQLSPIRTPSPFDDMTPFPSPTTTSLAPSPEHKALDDNTPPELPTSPPPAPPPTTLQRSTNIADIFEATKTEEEEKQTRDEEESETPPLPPTAPPPSTEVAAISSEQNKDEEEVKQEEEVEATPLTDSSKIDQKSVERPVSPRPLSMGPAPHGKRLEDAPFEIQVTKGFLGLGLTVGMGETGMIFVKSLTSRSPILKDGNIR